MSDLDLKLTALRQRLAELEEQKRLETEKEMEKLAFPLRTLEAIIDEKKKQLERNCYSKGAPLSKFYDQEKLTFLEPIVNMLKSLQERIEALETARQD